MDGRVAGCSKITAMSEANRIDWFFMPSIRQGSLDGFIEIPKLNGSIQGSSK